MKRTFLLKASAAHTAADFELRQVASTSGRLDVVCRCIQAALNGPKGLRRDVEFTAVLEGPPRPPLMLTISGSQVSELPSDEERVAAWIFDAFESRSQPRQLTIRRKSFERLIRELHAAKIPLFYLHENGDSLDILREKHFKQIGFILGDQIGLDAQSERFLDSLAVPRVAIGPRSYLSSSCIIFVNAFLDSIEG